MEKIKNREWRIGNLYFIKDKQGIRIRFRLNWCQKILFDNLWFLNVILKVRQLGVTTFFCILYLDDCIFNGMDTGLIAHTYKDAKKIFDSKVKYAWDNLSDALKEGIKVDTDSAQELKFTRGNVTSSIYVGTSLRSGTVQRLHLSETATIDQKYPAKSEEIKSGALNTVTEGQIVTMESTAKGPTGIFHDICLQAMDNKKKGDLTEMDWRFFFFAWWKHPQYELEGDIVIPVELDEYFNKLEINEGIKISKPKRNWYFKKLQTQKDSMKSEYPSTPEEAFLQSIEGAYYGKEMDKVLESSRIMSVPYNPLLPVDTWWDLGTSKVKKDATSIIFTQDIGLEIHIIDFYGNSGEGLPHYIRVLQDKGYIYGHHHAPHDIAVKELGTGKTRREAAAGLGLHFEVVPNIGFIDGVDMARVVLSKCYFDEKKTTRLVRALRTYRKEWDENLGKFKDNPLQNSSADPCLLAGTKILTNKGEKNIEDIKNGDKVITPFGIRKVLNSGKSGHPKLYYVLKYGSKEIKITHNHKVFVNEKLKYVDEIKVGDKLNSYNILNLLKWRIKKLLFLTGEDIGFREVITKDGNGEKDNRHHYIGQFGLNILEKFQKSVVSTIGMAIKRIMSLTIWNVSIAENTIVHTQLKGIKKNHIYSKNFLEQELKQQKFGTNQKLEESGIKNTEEKFGKIENQLQNNALNVAVITKHIIQVVQNFATIIVKTGIGIIELNPKVKGKYLVYQDVDVYNLTVEIDNVYYANGILVSNCDSFRMLAVGHRDIVQLGEYDEEEEELMRIKDNEANEQSIDPFSPFNF